MRILAIRGERLASLHEPFEVDFLVGPLAGVGLFAITGPTGAGKSTVLDAVCLALYGDTPRVEGSGGAAIGLGLASGEEDERLGAKDTRHLLSRGSRYGHAEVDFRGQDGLDYRARWSVAPRPRAKRLADPDMWLRRLGEDQVLATGPAATRKEVQRLVGFNFAEFQKAVMLPQGQFAEFLCANATDRAAILEKVAGGELYARVGGLATDRQGCEQRVLEALEAEAGGHQPLAPEARAASLAARDAARRESEGARSREQAAGAAIRWHGEAARLEGAVVEAEAGVAKASCARFDAEPRRLELVQVEQALTRQAVLAEAVRAERALGAATAEHDQKKAAALDAERTTTAARRVLVEAGQVRRVVDDEMARTRPQLDEAKRLDAEAGLARQAEAEATRGELASGEAALAAEKDAAAVGERRAVLVKKRDEADAWLAVRGAEAVAVAEWPRWRDLVARHRQAASQAAEARRRRDAAATPEVVEQARREAEAAVSAQKGARVASVIASEGLAVAKLALCGAEVRDEEARGALQRARDVQGLETRRSELRAGEPCPLCGATEHPWAGSAQVDRLIEIASEARRGCAAALAAAKADEERAQGEVRRMEAEAAKAEATARGAAGKATLLEAELAKAGRAAAEADLARSEDEERACEEALAGPFQGVAGWREQLARAPAALVADWDGRSAAHAGQRAERERAATELAAAEASLAAAGARAAGLATAAGKAALGARAAREEVVRLAAERGRLLGGRETRPVEAALAERLRQAEAKLDEARLRSGGADRGSAAAEAARGEAERRQLDAEGTVALSVAALESALGELGLDRVTLSARVARGEPFVANERGELERIEAAEREARTRLDERHGAFQVHGGARPALDRPAAEAEVEAALTLAAAADGRRVQAEAELVADARAQAALAVLGPKLGAQRARARLWAELGDLIGGGGLRSFRVFAQGLALDALLGHANRHLEQLAPRYRLSRVPGTDMELQVVDQDLGGAARGVNSLSGGETFLVSLALALGLSALSAKAARVESLFVDEGFGTLDPETLDQAMSVLEGLQATGRTVGVISHVPELHERIGVLVQVEKMGAGRSRVRTIRIGDLA